MALPAFLAHAADAWAALYDGHHAVSVTVRFLHLSGLVVGGGTALAADRLGWRAARSGPEARSAALAALSGAHRVVLPALALVLVTGTLLTAADRETFLASRVFWAKLGLVALLLANGAALVAAERRVSRGDDEGGWRWLRRASAASFALWLLVLYFGVWLTVAA